MKSPDIFGNENTGSRLTGSGDAPSYHIEIPEMEDTGSVEDQEPRRSLWGMGLIVATVAIGLAYQCFHLQVLQASTNRAQAEGNSIRIITQTAERGLILDANGTVLAQNDLKLALTIIPQELPAKKADRQAVYRNLESHGISLSSDEINLIENNRDKLDESVAIQTNISKDQSLLYQEWFSNLQGVQVAEIPTRKYASLPSLGQILGYVGTPSQANLNNGTAETQEVGKTGIEEEYNSQLAGTPGKLHAEVNAQGDITRYIDDALTQDSEPGDTLKLSIDSNLQTAVANALQQAINQRNQIFGSKTQNLGASAVVLNPNNGAILAMVSLPDYDSNTFSSGISQASYNQLINNPADPLLNRTIQGMYPSGSTVKPLIAATALQDGIINATRVLNTAQPITIGQSVFPDWKLHVSSDLPQAIAQSNDEYFYDVGGGNASQNVKGLGIDNLDKGLDAFGLGAATGVDLPGEAAGLTPGPAWKQQTQGQPWYIGDTYHQSIGQGYLLVTPLQMAAATAAIANGGTLYQPQLGWSLTNPTTGKETLLPHKVLNSNWISPANIQAVQQGMQMTLQPGGTAQLIGKSGISSAGKTGTAQFGTDGLTHSWYIGYAPADHPQYAFAVLIEGDGNSTEATEGSEPVVEEILRYLFNQPLQPGQQLDSQALVPTSAGTTSATPTPSPSPTP